MRKKIFKYATAPGIPAAAKEFAANVFNIIGIWANFLLVFSLMRLKKLMTVP